MRYRAVPYAYPPRPKASLTRGDKSQKFQKHHQRLYPYPDRHCAKAIRTLRLLMPSPAKWATYFRNSQFVLLDPNAPLPTIPLKTFDISSLLTHKHASLPLLGLSDRAYDVLDIHVSLDYRTSRPQHVCRIPKIRPPPLWKDPAPPRPSAVAVGNLCMTTPL